MAQDDQLKAIVSRMVSRGESEDAIAEVVRNYDAMQPAVSHEPTERIDPASQPFIDAMRSKGYEPTDAEVRSFNRMGQGAMGGLSTAAPTAVGQAATQFAPQVAAALKGGAERLYGGLLKAKDATLERFPNVVKDLINAGAPISQGGRRKVVEGIRKIGDEKQALLTAADQRAMIPRSVLRQGLDDVADAAIKNSDTPAKDIDKLAKIERDFIPDEMGVSPSRADRMKSKLQSESDRAYRQMKMGTRVTDIGAKAKTGIASSAKSALEAVEPKLEGVNARYASGKGQAEALRDSLKRADKRQVVGFNDLIGGTLGAAAGPAGIPVGVAAMRLLSNPRVGSNVAIGLDRVGRVPNLDQVTKAALLELLSEQQEQ